VATTVQKTQRSIVNFKSDSTMLVETLSGGPILSTFDVRWTPRFGGFYMFNVDATCLIEEGRWGIGVVERDNEGVVVAASS
jgi:hypothetical protein